jgi:hypothetical protein
MASLGAMGVGYQNTKEAMTLYGNPGALKVIYPSRVSMFFRSRAHLLRVPGTSLESCEIRHWFFA